MKGLKLFVSIGIIMILVASVLLSACAQEAAAPGAPTRITPQVPAQPATPTTPTTPTPTPAKPAPAPAAEVFKWKLQSHVAPGVENDMLKEMSALTEAMSDGRLSFDVFDGGALVPTEDQFTAVKTGMIEMARAAGSYYKGFIPEGDIEAGIPLMWRNAHDVITIVRDKGFQEILVEAYGEQGIRWLSIGASAPFCFWTREDIGGVEGLKGLKIRSFGLYMEVLQDVGAAAVYIPHAETYGAGQTGVIDASSTAAYVYQDLKNYEIFKHYYSNKWGMPTNNIVVNLEAWDSLSPDLQAILQSAGWLDFYNQDRAYNQIVQSMEGRMAADWGCTLHTLSGPDMQVISTAALPYYEEYKAKSPRMAEMIDIVQDYMKEVGYIK